MIKDGRINHVLEAAMQKIQEYKTKVDELEKKLQQRSS